MNDTVEGRFWGIDPQGFIVNDADLSKIPCHYQPAIDTAIEAYQTHLSDTIHSVYVRGTVPRGMAIPGVSDLDTFVVVTAGETTGVLPWAASVEKAVIAACPELTGVGFECWLMTDVLAPDGLPELPFALKTQSVCVCGDDLSTQLSHTARMQQPPELTWLRSRMILKKPKSVFLQ